MVSLIRILMLTVSLLASISFASSTNGRAGLSTDFFSLAGGEAGPFVRLLFKTFALVLVLEFILPVKTLIAIYITVPQLVKCSDTGLKIDY